MFIEQPPRFVRWIWRGIWRLKKPEKRVVYLTFDDGPTPETTERLLALLEAKGVRATFFCVGDNVRKFPELYAQLLAHGHRVGNHTMHHLKGFRTAYQTYIDDVAEAASYIDSTLLRPPYGRIKLSQLRHLRQHYTVVMWDVITRDYNAQLTPEQVFGIVRRYVRNGSIIVFHDSPKAAKNMFVVVPQTIDYLRAQGYDFELL